MYGTSQKGDFKQEVLGLADFPHGWFSRMVLTGWFSRDGSQKDSSRKDGLQEDGCMQAFQNWKYSGNYYKQAFCLNR